MTQVYNPGQAFEVVKFLPRDPKFFLIGGPGYGNEAQTIVARFPGVECFGWEPCPETYAYQSRDFPGKIYESALSDRVGFDLLKIAPLDAQQCTFGRMIEGVRETRTVPTVTLDHWDAVNGGRADRVLLWLDVEGAEHQALRGAEGLFARGAVDAVNVELLDRENPENTRLVKKFLVGHGFVMVGDWRYAKCDANDWVFRRNVS